MSEVFPIDHMLTSYTELNILISMIQHLEILMYYTMF